MVCESWAARELWLLSAVSQGSACLARKSERESCIQNERCGINSGGRKSLAAGNSSEESDSLTYTVSIHPQTKCGQAHNTEYCVLSKTQQPNGVRLFNKVALVLSTLAVVQLFSNPVFKAKNNNQLLVFFHHSKKPPNTS